MMACVCGNTSCMVPYGLCHCGCGMTTPVSTYNSRTRGIFKGLHLRYIPGHQMRPTGRTADLGEFKIDGVYCRLIPITRGLHTIVDAADYEWLSRWKWTAGFNISNKSHYAERHPPMVNGVRGAMIRMNRLILGMDCSDTRFADHANRNTLDNRRKNLRPANYNQNQYNQVKKRRNPTGFKGVSYQRRDGLYRAMIRANGKEIYVGSRKTAEAAYGLWCEAAKKLHGEFARFE